MFTCYSLSVEGVEFSETICGGLIMASLLCEFMVEQPSELSFREVDVGREWLQTPV